jgi:hypothetical protein
MGRNFLLNLAGSFGGACDGAAVAGLLLLPPTLPGLLIPGPLPDALPSLLIPGLLPGLGASAGAWRQQSYRTIRYKLSWRTGTGARPTIRCSGNTKVHKVPAFYTGEHRTARRAKFSNQRDLDLILAPSFVLGDSVVKGLFLGKLPKQTPY